MYLFHVYWTVNVNEAKSAKTRFQPKLNLTFFAMPFCFSLALSPWIWSRVFVRSSGYVAETNRQTHFDFKHATLSAISSDRSISNAFLTYCLYNMFANFLFSLIRVINRYCCCVSLYLNFHQSDNHQFTFYTYSPSSAIFAERTDIMYVHQNVSA